MIKAKFLFGCFHILKYLIMINSIISILTNDIEEINYYYITLTINKTGNISIFNSENNFDCPDIINYPDMVEINRVSHTIFTSKHYFSESNNTVKLRWKNLPNNTRCLFYRCSDIIKISFSNFDTSKVIYMSYMFYKCSSLISLDLSNFNTSEVTYMDFMFLECSSLISLDLSNFNTSKVTYMSYMFYRCSSLISLDLSNFNTSKVERMENMFYNCSSLISLDLSNFNTSEVIYMSYMFYGCFSLISLDLSNFNTSKVEYMDHMFDGCTKLQYLNLTNVKISIVRFNYNAFSFTPNIIIIFSKNDEYKNLLINYTTLLIYCDDSSYEPEKILKYDKDNDNEYNSSLKNYDSYIAIYLFPVQENSIVETYENEEENTFYNDSYMSTHSFPVQENSIVETYKNEKIIKIINKTELINQIIDSLINMKDRTDIDNGNDKEIREDNILITLTTTNNQKNNENINKTTIILGECENSLKNSYNISFNNSLYIIKLDVVEEGMKIPKIEYEVYYPLFDENLIKLNLTSCKDTKIDISIPISINDNIDKYNSSSEYYNNICSKTTSKNGTDIILNDRKNEFINDNMSLCEEDCDLINYDYDINKAKCSCPIKIDLPLIESIKFDKKKLLKRFIDVKNIFNFNIMKCYKNVFDKISIRKNCGFFIILFIELFYFICLIIFVYQSFKQLKNEIKSIILTLKTTKKKKETKQLSFKQNLIKLDVINIKQLNTIYAEHAMNTFKLDTNHKTDKSNTIILDTGNEINNSDKILEYKDFELNSLDYQEALKHDKRTYFQYYIALLNINHLLIFSFFGKNDYNSRIIKMFLFFFFFIVNLTVNAIFFNDSTMHKIYIDEGNYNFIYQIPQIIYSSIISIIINVLIKFLSLSQGKIVEIKNVKDKKGLDDKYKKLISTLKIKFAIFFILTFILLLIFWFYISCFCGIYVNTQTHLFKDTFISFVTSLIYPLGIYLLPGLIRIVSLKRKKSYLYKFSKLLQMI